MWSSWCSVALSAVAAAACSSSHEGAAGVADAAPFGAAADAARPVDAGGGAPDAKIVSCPPGLPASFGNLGTVTATKNGIGGSANVFVDLEADQDPRQLLVVKAIPGRGVFSAGIKPGTYDLVGADTDYQRCAACVYLFASYPEPPSLHLMAEKGRLVITSVSGTTISGRLEDISFRPIEIVYDGESCTGIDDDFCGNTICLSNRCGRQAELVGCTTAITRMTF
jgi:hypothetical protein